MNNKKRHHYETRAVVAERRAANVEPKFWLVWRNPFLRQRIFVYARRPKICLKAEIACRLDYTEALFYAPFEMQFTQSTADVVARCGNLKLLKWLYGVHPETCSEDAILYAAYEGQFETFKWLYNNADPEERPTYLIECAADGGHLEIIKWLHEQPGEQCSVVAMNDAAANGHYETVKWLKENRTEGATRNALYLAEDNGHDDIVAYLEEHCPWVSSSRPRTPPTP